nr:hypothetical protein [Tanacetum cinerariifolium]
MDNPNITIEEYIRLKEEKDRRRGQDFNWETATDIEVSYFDDVNYFKAFEAEFLSIVINNTLMSKLEVSSEPTVNVQSATSQIRHGIRPLVQSVKPSERYSPE